MWTLTHCGGNVNKAILEKFESFLKKANINLPYDTAISFLGVYPREMKTCPHEDLYINVHIYIHNSPKLDPITGRQNVIHPYSHNKILFNHKKEQTTDTRYNMDEHQKD